MDQRVIAEAWDEHSRLPHKVINTMPSCRNDSAGGCPLASRIGLTASVAQRPAQNMLGSGPVTTGNCQTIVQQLQ
jgi:hypothetical protein